MYLQTLHITPENLLILLVNITRIDCIFNMGEFAWRAPSVLLVWEILWSTQNLEIKKKSRVMAKM